MEPADYLIYFLSGSILIIIGLLIYYKSKMNKLLLEKYRNPETEILVNKKIEETKNEIIKNSEVKFSQKIDEAISYFRTDAIRRSGSVTRGKVLEHFAPFLLGDSFSADEIVFMGSPIDLISFTNIDGDKELSIDFIEVKTGSSSLNIKQKIIKDAINSGRIYYKKVFL